MAVNTLIFTLVGRDQLSNVLRAAGNESDKLGAKLGVAGKVIRGGLAVGAAGAVAMATGVGAAVKAAIPFDKTMRQVGAISGATGNDLKSLSALAIQMGKDTVFGAGDAAQAMLELSKGGITPAQIRAGALAGTLTLATAGGLELGDAATYLSNTLNTFGLQANQSNRVVAALAGGANASSASVESLGLALGQVGPGAKLAGMSLESTVAVLAAFDNAGVKGSDAGTSLKTMLQRLVPTTDLAANTMEDLGLKFTNAQGNFLPLRDIAQQLQTKLAGLSASQKQSALTAIFGADAYRAAAIMADLGAAGVDKYVKSTSDLNAAQALANVGVTGASGAWEQLTGSVETLAIETGQKLLPAFTAVTLFANDQLVPAAGQMIDKIGQFAGFIKTDVAPIVMDLGSRGLAQLTGAFHTVQDAVQSNGPQLQALGMGVLNLASWLGDTLLPVVSWLASNGIPLLGAAVGGVISVVGALTSAVQSHSTTAKVLAGLITAVFVPGWIMLGVTATISGAQQAAAWLLSSTSAVRAGVANSVTAVKIVAGWVAMGAAALASGATSAAIWALYAADAIRGAAAFVVQSGRVVGGWIVMGATATAQAARQVGAWVVMGASAVAGAASTALAGARVVGAWVLMGTQALLQAARLAAAWFIALGPVGWAIGALVLVGLAFVALWKKSETFRNIVTGVWIAVKNATLSAVQFLVGQFLGFASAMLNAAAKAFGWVPGLGPKLKNAAKDFDKFRDDVNAKLEGLKSHKIDIGIKYSATGINLTTPSRVGGLATGGPVKGPGGGTDDKAGLFALSNDEHVWTAAEVLAAGGHGAVEKLRAAAIAGQLMVPGMATGGPVRLDVNRIGQTPQTIANNAMKNVQAIQLRAAKILAAGGNLQPVLNWVKTQVGKPYVWGGVGPGGYDCSGLVSAAINVAMHKRNPYVRLGATGSMPWPMFAPGPGRFMVGWFKGSPGHTAATVQGVNIESAGGVGVRMGARARGASNSLFTNRMHVKGFARGGAVLVGEGRDGDLPYDLMRDKRMRKALGFRDGGWLYPGDVGFNETSKPEAVFNHDQLDGMRIDYERLADVIVRALKEARPVDVHQNFPTSGDPMAAAQAGAQRLVSLLGDI